MKALAILALIVLSVSALALLTVAFYCGKPIKRLFLNFIFGIGTLIIINITTKYTAVHIPINIYTVTGIGIFSIPAVIAFLILQVIFLN